MYIAWVTSEESHSALGTILGSFIKSQLFTYYLFGMSACYDVNVEGRGQLEEVSLFFHYLVPETERRSSGLKQAITFTISPGLY